MIEIICNKCQKINLSQNKFCIFCGNNLKEQQKQIEYENSVKKHAKEEYEKALNSFDGISIALYSKVAKLSGRISEKEAKFIGNKQNLLSIKILKDIMNNEKEDLTNIKSLCQKLNNLRIIKNKKLKFINNLLELAYIDLIYDDFKENLIIKIIHYLDIDFLTYKDIKNRFEPSVSSESTTIKSNFNGHLTIDESYNILGITKDDSISIIKKNYRTIAKDYHYDSLNSKNLPQDILNFAEEKSKKINIAYQNIKRQKGI
jgi:DnaJ like chaperone protein